MRIARALAAAALTLGLTATLAPAQASPQVASSAAAQMGAAPVQATAVEAPTKLTGKGPSGKVKVGKTIKVRGKLARKGEKGYRPLAKQNVRLLYRSWDGTVVLAEAKTSKSGDYTLKLKAEKWMRGGEIRSFVYFDGNSTSDYCRSSDIVIKVRK